MERNSTRSSLISLHMLIMLASFVTRIYAVQSDIDCLRSIKVSLEEPKNLLSSWDFSNNSEGSICRFTGIECWHPEESKVLNIRLPDMGLRGPFPMGIKQCTSLSGLDLSNNHLTGHIPSNVTDVLPFILTLDLSNNNLSGAIPVSFANASFINVLRLNNNQLTGKIPSGLSDLKRLKELNVANNRLSGPIPPDISDLSLINVLRLDNNQLTGQIPPKLSELDRLKEFSVANNRLSGQVPVFQYVNISEESYANNPGLCGAPLSPCEDHHDLFLSGFAVGLSVSTAVTTLFLLCFLPLLSLSNIRFYLSVIKNIQGRKRPHLIRRITQIEFKEANNTEESKIATMEKYVRRLSLEELKLATNVFDIKNVIGFANMGLMYKGVFINGLMLAVKRLHKFESFEKEFLQEIEILGRLGHINLVPLLGFCFEMENKFLVYKYMSNGTLHQWLHSRPQIEGTKMGWSLRLRIAMGIARGLAWLHHNKVLCVAHLKISSKCILLDDKFEPKISNFGYSTILMNTSGTLSSGHAYVDPHSSPDSFKEDVYSFGILLLELVSGREWPSEETDSSIFGEESNMIDDHLIGQGFDDDIYETLRIAKDCIHSHKDGATSMLEVYQSIRAIGMLRNKICDDSCINFEGNE